MALDCPITPRVGLLWLSEQLIGQNFVFIPQSGIRQVSTTLDQQHLIYLKEGLFLTMKLPKHFLDGPSDSEEEEDVIRPLSDHINAQRRAEDLTDVPELPHTYIHTPISTH